MDERQAQRSGILGSLFATKMTPLRRNPPSTVLSNAEDLLPSSRQHRAESGVRPLAVRTSQGRPRVLLIAPSTTTVWAYERALALDSDCDVEVVDSMSQASQRLIGDREFRLVLCPGSTSEGSASTFVGQLRQLNLLGCPRVVVFDGSEDASEVIDAIQMGVRQYISGPCPPSELARKVSRLLGLG
jgi:PleD family two-component response regulator